MYVLFGIYAIIICMSDFCKECIQSKLNLDDSYFEIIGNGLTISLFNTNKKTYKVDFFMYYN